MKYLDRQPMTFAGGAGKGVSLSCPKRDSTKFVYNPSTGEWFCERCGAETRPVTVEEAEK